jgi:hypothetical protein
LAAVEGQVSLDLARAYAQQRHDAAAVNMLVMAEQTAAHPGPYLRLMLGEARPGNC